MKKLLRTVAGRTKDMLEMDMATRERPTGFRVVVITILLLNVALIVYSIIEALREL